MIGADFLEEVGFEVVCSRTTVIRRLRLELDNDHGWKADVEMRRSKLLAVVAIGEAIECGGS